MFLPIMYLVAKFFIKSIVTYHKCGYLFHIVKIVELYGLLKRLGTLREETGVVLNSLFNFLLSVGLISGLLRSEFCLNSNFY